MAWLDQLGEVVFQDGRRLIGATFRGVAFHVESAERMGGRRAVRHEFPLRDDPFFEDMGRRARAFPLDGYVIGDDYLARRDNLITELEAAGPGELEHPYYGKLRVICTGFRVRESTADGGMARFAIDFEQTEETPPFPVATPAAEAKVAVSAAAAITAEHVAFLANYDVTGQALSALQGVTGIIQSFTMAFDAAISPYVQGVQDLAALKLQLFNLGAAAGDLVRQPLDLLASLEDVAQTLVELPLVAPSAARVMLGSYDFTPWAVRPGASDQEATNYAALYHLVQALPVIQAAQQAALEQFDSYDAAVALREEVGTLLDELADSAADEAYPALVQLRADLVRAVPGEASDLPRLVSYTPAVTTPSLVLAHLLYGELSREDDLVVRNRAERPGFIVGGTALEVLSGA